VLETVERRVAPETFRVMLGEAAPEIARLVPHIRRHYPDIPAALPLPDPDQARRYLQLAEQVVRSSEQELRSESSREGLRS